MPAAEMYNFITKTVTKEVPLPLDDYSVQEQNRRETVLIQISEHMELSQTGLYEASCS